MKVYISGPMTGKPALNGKEFYEAEAQIMDAGKIAINPHRISHDVELKCSELGTIATYEDYMKADLSALLNECSMVYMLNGWKDSPGARVEHDVAKICGLEIIYQGKACK